MSERERWIVYPLLFFALGAALRDKLAHRVESKEIYCQSLRIVDPHDSNRILAELGAGRTLNSKDQRSTSFLRVDETTSKASLVENIICKQGIRCQNLSVIDPENVKQATVFLGTGETPNYQPGELPRRMGVIQVKDTADNLVSELRADQFLGNRMVCKSLSVTDPENGRPLVQIGTIAMPTISLNEEDAPISHQGVIVLNNQYIGLRSPRPQPKSKPGESR